MSKNEFLEKIREGLYGLPQDDIEKSVSYYSEMIDDRTEDGLTEEEAVEGMGSPEEAVSQILMETPLAKVVKAKTTPKKPLSAVIITLLIIGLPIWLPLLIAAFCIILAVYIVLWSVVITLFSVNLAFAVSALTGFAGGFAMIFSGNPAQSGFMIAVSLMFAGLSVLLFIGSVSATKGIVTASKKIVLLIKKCFIKRHKEN